MGEVYRAKDTRLDRTVAIKVLPQHLSSSPEFKQRFEREARAISQLTHPHICTLHDIGHQDGVEYLVMEHLEGETLAARLAKGALPLDQVLRFGIEIASALDKAHRSGVVHRDLKPGNIMLTKNGAKLLDFGLAKTASLGAAAPDMATMTKPLTSHGQLLGTFQYMAPEQLEGRDADARTDLFAFGATLYEMVTGKRAFEGKSQASLISAIMSSEPPPIAQLQPMTPPALDRLVRTCLAKDPDDRIQTAHDVLLQLRWIVEGGSQAGSPAPLIAARKGRHRLWMAATLLLLAACVVLALVALRKPTIEPPLIRSFIPAPEGTEFATTGDMAGPVAVSPDGTALAFTAVGAGGERRLWVRPLNSTTAAMLPETTDATLPFWSGDSRSIGYFADGKLRRIDAAGGMPITICDAENGRGGTWNRDGVIVFAAEFQSPISRVSAQGGPPTAVTALDKSMHTSHRWPSFCPDGSQFLYLAVAHGANASQDDALYLASLAGGEPRLLIRGGANAAVASDRLLFWREDALLAAPFDAAAGRLAGEPAVIATNVVYTPGTWLADFSASRNGILAYHTGRYAGSRLLRFDRAGKQLGTIGQLGEHESLRLSPDARRAVASSRNRPNSATWIYEIARDARTILAMTDGWSNLGPVWSPDGRSIAYASVFLVPPRGAPQPNRIKRRPSTGGDEEVLYESKDEMWLNDWSRDGNYLLFCQGKYIGGKPCDIWVLPLAEPRKPFVFLKTPFTEDQARFSPDGRWIAYTSDESGRIETYVAPFDPPSAASAPTSGRARAGRWQISTSGGEQPAWRADGKELYYVADSKLMAVEVDGSGESFEIKTATPLFEADTGPDAFGFDASPDGQWFVLNAGSAERLSPISLVVNWTAELKK